MSKVIRIITGAVLVVTGVLTGNFALALAGAQLLTSSLFGPKVPRRAAAAAQLQLGEQPRQAILGRMATAGSLVDAFNYGGKYRTDWEVLVIALADHRCDALEGFFVDDTYVAYNGDGTVSGFNGQLQVFFRSGTWDQTVPSILTTNGPGWTANDRGRGIAYVVVAYKADSPDAENPVYPSGRPRFRWVVRGLRCYQARKDSTVGGSGAHRWDNPATWEWTENPIDIRHNWQRGIYAGDRVTEPGMLLIGRGLSPIEAPPANVFPRANLCDEVVGGQARYRIGGLIASNEPFIDIETDFAAACAGVISQPQGAVEVDPGQAKAPVAHFTDADLIVGSKVTWNRGILGQQDEGWVNTVAARFTDPGQRWAVRGAPVRRDLADVIADGGPREQQPQLDLVTNAPQAQRVAEIIRRLGRLWGRGQVTLPPGFAFIEEGDWVTWQSDRRFGGATLTFQVEAWGSDKNWHHQLTLRQISASVFSDTAPLDDGVVASNQPAPLVIAAPGAGVWSAAAVLLGSASLRVPNLRVAGATDDPAADFVVFEYVPQVAAPDGSTIWTFAASSRPDVRLLDIPVPEGGTFWVAVSYVVDGIQGPRRVLGPLSTSGLSFSDGSPVAPVAPANANRVPFSRFEKSSAWQVSAVSGVTGGAVSYSTVDGLSTLTYTATAGAVDNFGSFISQRFPVAGSERLSCQFRLSTNGRSRQLVTIRYYDAAGAAIAAQPLIVPEAGISTPSQFPFAGFTTAPANAVSGEIEAFVFATSAGALSASMSQPMITSAAPGQTGHPAFTPGPNADDAADVTLSLSGTKSATFNYSSTGALDPSAQLPATLTYLLSNQAGPITSGVTWFYRVIEGSVNGFTAGDTNRTMTVSAGVGTLTLDSLDSNTAQIEVFATFGGATVSDFATLTKVFAPPTAPPAGGPATVSQTSGFTNVTSTSFGSVSNELQVTSTTTTQTVDVQLSFMPFGTIEGFPTIEVQVERWNGTAWVAMGAPVTAGSSQQFDSRINNYRRTSAVFNFQRTATITAGTNQRTRVRARRTSGTINHSVTGTLTLSA